MDLRSLEYFVAAADEGGFSKAARRLQISQPSLSDGIRKLEREFGTPLFHRVGRGVVLSEAGEVLLASTRRIMQEIEEARLSMVALRGLRGGRVTVSSPPGLAVEPLAQIIAVFRRRHPGVTIAMEPTEDGSLAARAVLDATCEIGLTDRPLPSAELRGHVIARKELMLVLPPGSPPAPEEGIEPAELAGVPFIGSMPGTRARALLEQAQHAGAAIPVVVETPHRDAIVPLVLNGVGAAFLPKFVATEAARLGAVVAPLRPRYRYDVVLAHRDRPLTAAGQAFLACALAPNLRSK